MDSITHTDDIDLKMILVMIWKDKIPLLIALILLTLILASVLILLKMPMEKFEIRLTPIVSFGKYKADMNSKLPVIGKLISGGQKVRVEIVTNGDVGNALQISGIWKKNNHINPNLITNKIDALFIIEFVTSFLNLNISENLTSIDVMKGWLYQLDGTFGKIGLVAVKSPNFSEVLKMNYDNFIQYLSTLESAEQVEVAASYRNNLLRSISFKEQANLVAIELRNRLSVEFGVHLPDSVELIHLIGNYYPLLSADLQKADQQLMLSVKTQPALSKKIIFQQTALAFVISLLLVMCIYFGWEKVRLFSPGKAG
jgi:hypothetical protein